MTTASSPFIGGRNIGIAIAVSTARMIILYQGKINFLAPVGVLDSLRSEDSWCLPSNERTRPWKQKSVNCQWYEDLFRWGVAPQATGCESIPSVSPDKTCSRIESLRLHDPWAGVLSWRTPGRCPWTLGEIQILGGIIGIHIIMQPPLIPYIIKSRSSGMCAWHLSWLDSDKITKITQHILIVVISLFV